MWPLLAAASSSVGLLHHALYCSCDALLAPLLLLLLLGPALLDCLVGCTCPTHQGPVAN
jgi:hypothetical protein